VAALQYHDLPWTIPDNLLGRFDLIIGSDILYERDHAAQVSQMVLRHAHPDAEVLITDPGRGNSTPFTRLMGAQGFEVSEQRSRFDERDVAPFRGRLLSYRRSGADLRAASVRAANLPAGGMPARANA